MDDAEESPWQEGAHYTVSESLVADQEVSKLQARFSDVCSFLFHALHLSYN